MRNIIVRSGNLSSGYLKSRDAIDKIEQARNDLLNFKSDADAYSSNWVDKYYMKHLNKPYCSVDRSLAKYWKTVYSNGKSSKVFRSALYEQDVADAAKKWVAAQRSDYLSQMSNLLAKIPKALERVKKVKTALYKLDEVKNEFNETPINIEEAYALVNADSLVGEDFVWSTESYIDSNTGEKVEYQVLYKVDEATNKKLSINEAVNCAFTTLGAMSDSIVAIASSLSSGCMTDEEIDKMLNDMVNDTGAVMSDYANRGFFGVTSLEGLRAMYEDVTGLKYDEETIKADYNSIFCAYMKDSEEQGDYLASLVAAGLVGPFGMAAAIGKAINDKGTMTDEEKEKNGLSKYIKEEEKFEEVVVELPKYDSGLVVDVSPTPIAVVAPKPAAVEKPKVTGGGAGGGTGVVTETATKTTVTSEVKDGGAAPLESVVQPENSSVGFETITESPVPEKIEDIVPTGEEIDIQASDEYFKQYSVDEIYNNRTKLFEEYSNMSEREKAFALKDLGYREDVVADIITNGTAGVTAYVIGHQNQAMANIANQMALQQGAEHNTIYNASLNSSYFTSGSANVDLTPTSSEVQRARTVLNNAKVSYDSAITEANSAIDDANKAKEEYNKKVLSIKKKNGEDPSNWTEKQIEEYNQVTEKYNGAVELANEAAKKVELEKANYDSMKQTYETAKADFADKVKEEVDNSLGEDQTSLTQTLMGIDENGEFVPETRVNV